MSFFRKPVYLCLGFIALRIYAIAGGAINMAFSDDIAKIAEQVRKRAEEVSGEEATKMGLIVPFLSTLGYDVFDPTEVITSAIK
jgi:heme O synthase-like polyprenyltransferase